MGNVPFAAIADLMNRLLDQADEHRRQRKTAEATSPKFAAASTQRATNLDQSATRSAA